MSDIQLHDVTLILTGICGVGVGSAEAAGEGVEQDPQGFTYGLPAARIIAAAADGDALIEA